MANAFETGFLRDTTTRILAVTTDATGATWQEGFLRAPTGELVVTTDGTGATWQEGFLRAPNGALVVEQDGAGSYETGFVRASSGALEVSQSAAGSDWESGFIRTASGLLLVTGLLASYSAVILADNPTSYWRLNETSGVSAADEQGLNNGTYFNSPTLGDPALAGAGTAVHFGGGATQEELVLPNAQVSTTCSIEFWFKWTSGVTLMRDATQSLGWIIGFDNAGTFTVRVGGSTTVATSKTTASLQDGNAHHLVVSKSGADLTIYLDGVSIGTSAAASNTVSTGSWHIARNGLTPGQFTDCVIDEIAIYPTALTAGQVTAHFNAA